MKSLNRSTSYRIENQDITLYVGSKFCLKGFVHNPARLVFTVLEISQDLITYIDSTGFKQFSRNNASWSDIVIL